MPNQSEVKKDSPQGKVNGTSENNDTMSDQSKTANGLSLLQMEQEIKKSKVRVFVTYVATAFIFGGGGFLIIWFAARGKNEDAMVVFNIILPIAAGIVTYWFAARSNRETNKDK